jgi:hypothetical protein
MAGGGSESLSEVSVSTLRFTYENPDFLSRPAEVSERPPYRLRITSVPRSVPSIL